MARSPTAARSAWPPAGVLSPTRRCWSRRRDNPDLLEINLGPNHPSTHGVLRLVATLDGEIVVGLRNELGYVHTGIEKNIEQKSYWKAITYVPRMDYLSFFSRRARRSAWRSRSCSSSRCRAAASGSA